MSSVASLSNGLLTPTTSEMMTLDMPTGDDDLWPTDQDVAEMALMTYNPPQPLVWDRRSLKRLPSSAIPVKLIGEGSANAVFEIGFPQGDPAASTFKGWLLRVAKAPTNGSPSRFNYLKQQEYYVRKVQCTLSRDRVVQQELVVIRDSNIVRKLNNFLFSIDHERKKKFRGSYVASSNWGFLVEDMRPENPEETILIEFKPKWLAQSPSAPSGAIRCRQCAMHLSSLVKSHKANTPLPDVKPCPLTLANDYVCSLTDNAYRIAPKLEDEMSGHYDVFNSIANHQTIHDLRAAQIAADPDGPLRASREDLNFCWAMTIRDCTCFAQISRDASIREPLKIRLGDFDFKDPLVKFDRWQQTEQDLISEGFYTADWILSGNTYYQPPSNCILEQAARTVKPAIIHIQHPDSTNVDYKNTCIQRMNQTSSLSLIRTDASEVGWGIGLKAFREKTSKFNGNMTVEGTVKDKRLGSARPQRPEPPPLIHIMRFLENGKLAARHVD